MTSQGKTPQYALFAANILHLVWIQGHFQHSNNMTQILPLLLKKDSINANKAVAIMTNYQ